MTFDMVAKKEVLLSPLEFNSVDSSWRHLYILLVGVVTVVLISLTLLDIDHSVLVCVSYFMSTVLLVIHVLSSNRGADAVNVMMMIQIVSLFNRSRRSSNE